MLTHCKSKSLTNYIVERNGQKEASKQKKNNTVYPVEFSPLGLFFEHIVDLGGLSTFPDRER
jgi:hypothetical protein